MFTNSKQLADFLVRIKENEFAPLQHNKQNSFAASDNSTTTTTTAAADYNYDQLCANTIRKIMIQSLSGINNNNSNSNNSSLGTDRSYAAAAATGQESTTPTTTITNSNSSNSNRTRAQTLLNFIFNNKNLR